MKKSGKKEPIRPTDVLSDGTHEWTVLRTLPGGKLDLFDKQRARFGMFDRRDIEGWQRVAKPAAE